MKNLLKITSILVFFLAVSSLVSADRGYNKKRNNIHLNIVTTNTLKNSIPLNLKSGLNYKGSILFNHQQIGNSLLNNTLISFKKGNTIYILPYNQKVLISDYSSASGYKLIIRHK